MYDKSAIHTIIAISATLFILFAVSLFMWMQKQVIVVDGNNTLTVKTMKNSVAEVLEETGIKLHDEDLVRPSLESPLKEGMEIKITRAFPVKIFADGKQHTIMTVQNSVMAILKNAGIALNPKDKVTPDLNSIIDKPSEIRVVRVTEDFIKENKRIYYHLIKKKNDQLEKGVVRVIQQGHEGLKELTIKVTYEDGKEVNREVVDEKIIKEHQDKIVEYGTIDTFITSRGEEVRFKKVLNMIATAYDAGYESTGKTPDHPEYGITYTGITAQKGVVAVDPKVIPLGTRLYVEGYGFAVAADIGSAIKGNRIDLYYDSHEEAIKYGRRKVKVYILANN
ncbi:MAG: hypothetical protein PWQ82_395 [Thermosediminibacterales bacterium]|nr:hypothetical protein [Thermosediminibacterales bacterium]